MVKRMRRIFAIAKYFLSTVILMLAFAVQPGGCVAQQKTARSSTQAGYKYDTAGAVIEGTLTEREVYGPPGYGETPSKDERRSIFVLKLSQPIAVSPLANTTEKNSANLDAVRNIHEVQLFVSRLQAADVRKLIGRIVVAVGTLNEAVAPSQYTKVWLDVQSLDSK